MFRRVTMLAAAAAALSACAPAPAVGPGGVAVQGNTNSAIAGATLRCPGDYPDSRLVFAPDGTVSGRYGGQNVTGSWSATAPDRVEMLVRAGGVAIRDTISRTSAGWRGENTACG